MKITKGSIEKLATKKPHEFIWDDTLKGFGVKVYKSGRKSFVVQGRLYGRNRRFTIGAFGSPWTAEQARKKAFDYLSMLANGIDPTAEQKARRLQDSFAVLIQHYQDAISVRKKPATQALENSMINRHILPLLGKKRVLEIDKRDIQKFVIDIADGKTAADVKTGHRGRAIVKGGKGSANRSLEIVSAVLSYAVENNVRPDNPAIGVKKFKLRVHDRYLNNDELLRLSDALNSAEWKGVSPYAVAAIRFMLLSGCRSGEALSLRHSWIDFDNKLVKLPDSKTGQRIMLLGEGAVQLLSMMEPLDGSPLVFPSSAADETQISIQKIWRAIREEADLEDVRLHDLRHNFASAAVSSGESLYIVAKLLGHSQVRTTQRYAHLAPDPVKSAADSVSNRLAEIMGGESSTEKLSTDS